MRVLVTGAAGFVGSALVKALMKRGDDVWVMIHDSSVDPVSIIPYLIREDRVIRGSLVDLATCERAIVKSDPHAVFHLGAQAIVPHAKRDPHATLEVNVRGTYNLLEAFRRHRSSGFQSAMIVASSDKAYGEVGVGGVYHESHPMRGRGPYDVSKSCTDLIAQSYALSYGLPIGIVRAGNIYGPGDRDMSRLIPSICNEIARGRPPRIASDGTPIRDYIYIDDAVSAYLVVMGYVFGNAMNPDRRPAFNFSGGEPTSVIDVVRMAIDIEANRVTSDSGRQRIQARESEMSPIVLGTRTGEIQKQVLDNSLSRQVLHWRPEIDLHMGLGRTLEYWRKNP